MGFALIVFIVSVMFVRSSLTISIQAKSLNVNEEEEAGTVIAEMSKLVEINKTFSQEPEFKILSQKFLVDKSVSRRKQAIPSTKWLAIDKKNGQITCLRRLDRERECSGSKTCEVNAKVVIMPQIYFQMVNLKITILDINDNAPIFRDNLQPLNISENAVKGTSINIDLYRARDSDLGVNADVNYSLSENDVFDLRQYRGLTGDSHIELILRKKLDYETEKQFTLRLKATDNGERKKISNEIDLVISVVDANDNDPVFTEEEYEVTLKENLLSGYVIKTVRAVDLDDGQFGTVRYFLSDRETTGSDTNVFSKLVKVDEKRGEVSLIQHLDREAHNGIKIPIEARDMDPDHQRIGHTWLLIRVMDINDNAPVITVNFIIDSDGAKAYLPETSDAVTFVAYVIVSDADDGRNGEVTTTITSRGFMASGDLCTDSGDTFKLVKTGLIQTNTAIDRELCGQYEVSITACDEGVNRNCTTKMVIIDILDVNEHTPVFEAPKKRVTLREDSFVGTIVTSVQAYDGDSENLPSYRKSNVENEGIEVSKSGNVQYSITGNERRFFTIDPITGKIVLERPLDRESASVWRLNVIAKDGGLPNPLEGTCVVEIEVTDVNDNFPIFTNPSVNNSLLYASTQDETGVIAHVKAIDKDFGSNAMLRYSILQSPERISDLFEIDSVSGEVSFSKKADLNNTHILHREHEIMIQASDHGVPSLSSVTVFRIYVTNEPLVNTNHISQITTPQTTSMDFMMLAIGLGSATFFLIIVIVIIIIKCRRENEKVRTYRCRDAEAKTSSCVSCNCHESSEDVRSETNTVPSSNPDTNSTVVHACNKDWNVTNNRHETDSVMSGSAGYSSNSSHLTKSDVSATSARYQHSSPNDRTPTITVLSAMDTNITSPIKKIGGRLHSIQDSDSGRGESETDAGSYDVASDAGGRYSSRRCPLSGGLDDVFQKEMEEYQQVRCGPLGPRCTDQCLRFGHSDLCWMPSPDKKFGNRLECIRETQMPTANSARIISTKPRFYSERSHYNSNDNFIPRTCSKATSIDQISQISSSCSAPERSVSNEQHFVPSNDGKRRLYSKMTTYPSNYTRHQSLTRDGNMSDSYKTSNFSNKPRKTRLSEKMGAIGSPNEELSLLPNQRMTSDETQHIIDNINKLLV